MTKKVKSILVDRIADVSRAMLLQANSKDTGMSNDDFKNTAFCFMGLVMAGTKAEPREPLSDGEIENIVILSAALTYGHP